MSYRELFDKHLKGNQTQSANGWINAFCPFCEDPNQSNSPSFGFEPEKGSWKCHSCQLGGPPSDFIGYLKIENYDKTRRPDAKKLIKHLLGGHNKEHPNQAAPLPEQGELDSWHAKLLENDAKIKELLRNRYWSKSIIEEFGIGFHLNRVTIPVIKDGIIMNVRRYQPGGKIKMIGIRGHNSPSCFPYKAFDEEEILLVEGEPDCLAARSFGFNALTFTGGAGGGNKIPSIDLDLFTGKKVAICYDTDKAGKEAAPKVAAKLRKFCEEVRILDISPFLDGHEKAKDITDMIGIVKADFPTKLREVWDAAPAFLEEVQKDNKEYTCSVEHAVDQKYVGKNIKFNGMVIGKSQQPYLVIDKLQVRCDFAENMDLPQCQFCRIAQEAKRKKQVVEWQAEPNDADWLIQINKVTGTQMKSVNERAGFGCDKYEVLPGTEYVQVEELIVSQMVTDTSRLDEMSSMGFTQRNIFARSEADGHDINAPYEFHGTAMPQPWNQVATNMVTESERVNQSVDHLDISEALMNSLSIFQVDEKEPAKEETTVKVLKEEDWEL